MALTKAKIFSLFFIVVGSAAIVAITYIAHRFKYKNNGPLVCFNLCCKAKSDKIMRIIFRLIIINIAISENMDLEQVDLQKPNDINVALPQPDKLQK